MVHCFQSKLCQTHMHIKTLAFYKQSKTKWLSIEKARENRLKTDWENYAPSTPNKMGITVFEDYPLEELKDYIDWTPFFIAWELAGKYPRILNDKIVGEEYEIAALPWRRPANWTSTNEQRPSECYHKREGRGKRFENGRGRKTD